MKKRILLLLCTVIVLFLASFGIYKIMNSRKFQFFGGIVNRVNTKEKVVALTFDDGPSKKVDKIFFKVKIFNLKIT